MSLPPITWQPSPNFNLRDRRYPLQGDVSHRIVGTGPSAVGLFLRSGTASSHFVIGHTQSGALCPRCGPITGARGTLFVTQMVDLAHMAWTNGDVRGATWPRLQAGVNPNLTTITTEHEDMGAAGRHIVTDHVWEASMQLKRLLRSGDIAAIRAAGIRVSTGAFGADALVARMAALPIDGVTYIDHHQIAGANKPWCWRDFDGDRGFPSRLPGLLAHLAARPIEEDDISKYLEGAQLLPIGTVARLRAGASGRRLPIFDPTDYDAHLVEYREQESTAPAFAWVEGTNITLADGTVLRNGWRTWLMSGSAENGIFFFHDGDFAAYVEPSAESQAELDAAKSALADATAALAAARERIAAARIQAQATVDALAA